MNKLFERMQAGDQALTEFLLEHRRTIDRIAGGIRQLFYRLRTKGVILQFDEAAQIGYDPARQRCVIKYECKCPGIAHPVLVRLVYLLDKRQGRIDQPHSASRSLTLYLDRNAYVPNAGKRIAQVIASWRRGAQNELHFNSFLQRLCRKFQAYNAQGYHVSEHKDWKEGIDFTVRYFRPSRGQWVEVGFNLKSSPHFVERHRLRYPMVSSFVCSRSDLHDEAKLASRFIRFILRASQGVAHE